MTIKFREVIFSLIIIAALLIPGFLISNRIVEKHDDKVASYTKALQVDDNPELFTHALQTRVGKVLAYGEVRVLDPVEFEGKLYSCIKRVEQHYNMHTRTITVNGKTQTQIYWSWDTYDTDYFTATREVFLGLELPYGTLNFENNDYIKTDEFEHHKRYVYYGTGVSCEGTAFIDTLADPHKMYGKFYCNRTIPEVLKSMEHNIGLIFFWIGWSLLICGAVVGFYYLENKWLD